MTFRNGAAAAILAELGDHYFHAVTLNHLGDTRQAARDMRAAVDAWRQALTLFESHGYRGADEVRVELQP